MIDMLMQFEDEQDAIKALAPHGLAIDGVIVHDQVIPVAVTFDHGPGDGIWLAHTADERHFDLEPLCTLVLSRHLSGEVLSDFVLVSPHQDHWVDSITAIEPAWPGSDYPLGKD